MTKNQKLITKFKTAKSITWLELVKCLETLGFERIESTGSRVNFQNGSKDIIKLHKPHPQKEVKDYILKRVRKLLKEWDYI